MATVTAGCTGVLDGDDSADENGEGENGDGENGGDGNGEGENGDGENGEGDAESMAELPAHADWLAADLLSDDNDQAGFFYIDVQRVLAEWPEDAQREFEIEGMADELGVEPEDIEGMVVLERSGDLGPEMTVAVTGSFDKDALVAELSDGMETETFGEYEVIMDQVAVGTDAVVIGDEYASLIDAHTGEIDRIANTDDEWDAAIRNVADSGLSGVIYESDDDHELLGVAMDAENEDVAIEAYVHFDDAETAEAEQAEAEADAEEEFVEDGEIHEVSVDGTVVIVEGTIYDFEW